MTQLPNSIAKSTFMLAHNAFLVGLLAVLGFNNLATCGNAHPVRLLDLLSRPDAFDGKVVEVRGYLHAKFEDYNLYFSKEHADHLSTEYAIQLAVPTVEGRIEFHAPLPRKAPRFETYDCRRVILTGLFRKEADRLGPHLVVSAVQLETRYFDGSKEVKETK